MFCVLRAQRAFERSDVSFASLRFASQDHNPLPYGNDILCGLVTQIAIV